MMEDVYIFLRLTAFVNALNNSVSATRNAREMFCCHERPYNGADWTGDDESRIRRVAGTN